MTNGKRFLHQNNLMFVEKKEPKEHLQGYIVILKTMVRTIVHAVMQNFFHPKQSLIPAQGGQVSLSQ